jgi:hypothetical protein
LHDEKRRLSFERRRFSFSAHGVHLSWQPSPVTFGTNDEMEAIRRTSLLITLLLLSVALTLASLASRPALGSDAAGQLAAASRYFDSVAVQSRTGRPVGARGDELALSLAYIERLRLGMGSPFRLVDQARRDPRLGAVARRRAAWGLLARLRRGDAYSVDPVVLDGAGPTQADGRAASGFQHLRLIERAVAEAGDPRVGELAVRMAYMIAAAERTISPSSATIATQVAALLRDRALATADIESILRDAQRTHGDVLEIVSERRIMRELDVEQPTLAPLATDLQVEAMNRVPRLLRSIRALGDGDVSQAGTPTQDSPLGDGIAARVAALGLALPPVAPIAITMSTHREALMPRTAADDGAAVRDVELLLSATNEETLIARYARLTRLPDSLRRAPAQALLASAVALRPLAQADPWFPGDPGPSAASLTGDFGLASVSFDRRVPAEWRPYFLRELSSALDDLRDVLPGLSTTGLRVSFGADALPDSALAMHDPRGRVLRLSIYTSAGTIAHELAHDLDWQAARRLYADGTGYSTDRAMHEERGLLANSIRGLAGAHLVRPPGGASARAAERPAELFARGTDWLVASALARRGRVDGYLTAIQDALLTGYVAGAPAAVGPAGTQALMTALEQMTYLPVPVRDAFISQWADPAAIDPALSLRRALETPVQVRRFGQAGNALTAPTLALLTAGHACRGADGTAVSEARARLIDLAIDARARGIALRRARTMARDRRPAWAQSLLGNPPFAPEAGERTVQSLRAAIRESVGLAPAGQGLPPGRAIPLASSVTGC